MICYSKRGNTSYSDEMRLSMKGIITIFTVLSLFFIISACRSNATGINSTALSVESNSEASQVPQVSPSDLVANSSGTTPLENEFEFTRHDIIEVIDKALLTLPYETKPQVLDECVSIQNDASYICTVYPFGKYNALIILSNPESEYVAYAYIIAVPADSYAADNQAVQAAAGYVMKFLDPEGYEAAAEQLQLNNPSSDRTATVESIKAIYNYTIEAGSKTLVISKKSTG